jgi:hypothetical protein
LDGDLSLLLAASWALLLGLIGWSLGRRRRARRAA